MTHAKITLQSKTSEIHGRGLYATVDIDEDTPHYPYVGEKITKKESRSVLSHGRRKLAKQVKDSFTSSSSTTNMISMGGSGDNLARYMNHSGDGNCEEDQLMAKSDRSIQDIKKGDELVYDYATTWSIS